MHVSSNPLADSIVKHAGRWAVILAIAIGLPLLVRAYVAEVYGVASDSMIPTLSPGDKVLINRMAYRDLTFCLSSTCKPASGQPSRGDVIVFTYPGEPDKPYIKRVIGLAGETVTYHDDRLQIDQTAASYSRIGTHYYSDERAPFSSADALLEELPGHRHRILERPEPLHAKGAAWHVAPGHVFVLGDNRDRSNDSRFRGTVPVDQVTGRALAVLWSWNETEGAIRWQRLFRRID